MFVLAIIVPLVIVSLALYTLLKSKRGLLSISFAFLCINLTLVITTNAFLNASFVEDRTIFFELFSFLGIMVLFFLALFFKTFPKKDKYSPYYSWFMLIFLIPYSIYSYLLFTDQWVDTVALDGTTLTVSYFNNTLSTIWQVLIIVTMIVLFIPMGLRLKNATGTDKTRIQLMITGLGISALLSVQIIMTFPLIPPLAQFTWMYPFTFIPFVIITIYAIVRYRFMGARLALRSIITKAAFATIIVAVIFFLYRLNLRLFGQFNGIFSAVSAISGAIIFVTGYDLLIRRLQLIYDTFLFPQLKGRTARYDELLKVTTESIDLTYITNRISNITQEMFVTASSRVLLATDEIFSHTFVDPQGDITVLDELLHTSHPSAQEQQAIDYLTAEGIQLNIPLISHAGIIAVLQLGEKQNNEAFTSDEIALLSSMQRHLGIALENAQLFYELAHDKETIKEEHAKLEVVLSNIVDAVAALDDNGMIIFVNKAVLELTGKKEESLVGHPFDEHIIFTYNGQSLSHEQFFPKEHTDHPAVYSYPEPVELQSNDYQKRFIKVTGATIRQSTPTAISQIIMLHDVTKEIQLETMKLDFVSMAAHELRTPLTSIRGYTEMAQREIDDKKRSDDDIKVFLERIMINATDLNTLVDNLLNVSQIEQGSLSMHLRPVEINKVVDSLLPDFQSLAAAREQTFTYDKPAEALPVVLADRSKIAEVYKNIVTNALKYTPTHGTITLRIWHDEQFVYSSVSDNGPGIAADALPYMFTKFFRVQGPLEAGSKGTGLGLYISKSIVSLHGGDIWVDSIVGEGSTFTFKLPWSKSTPTPAPEEYKNEPMVNHLIRLKSKE